MEKFDLVIVTVAVPEIKVVMVTPGYYGDTPSSSIHFNPSCVVAKRKTENVTLKDGKSNIVNHLLFVKHLFLLLLPFENPAHNKICTMSTYTVAQILVQQTYLEQAE